ncbi:hypothetical protein [Vibrio owensii]|uniref:hypothetical protein n=1 Tax=Vibrio owensii TaxID=696485 RepID=UPI001F11C6A6|nr:hypothetical protein [Vibrio owensii]
MKYDKQYYLLCESGHAGFYMLGQAGDSDEGLEHLMAQRSLKREVKGFGKVEVCEGNKRVSPLVITTKLQSKWYLKNLDKYCYHLSYRGSIFIQQK